jgi:ComF family protein
MIGNGANRLRAAVARIRATIPGRCVLCLARDARDGLCDACSSDLPLLDAARCPVCALPGPGGVPCGNCLRHPPAYDGACVAGPYAFPSDALIATLKYGGRLAIAPVLGRLLARAVPGESTPDLIVPMPLAAARLRSRGFNQALEIARALPARFADRVVPDLLERQRDTAPQASLPMDQRDRNVRGAFHCIRPVSNRTVVIVDDVMTTGATLHEAAVALKLAGATSVRGWIVARTLLHN